MKYSVLQFNFNRYDKFTPPVYDEDCEYVFVTDHPEDIKCDWVKVIEMKPDSCIWETCFYLRYHPFEFVTNDICVTLDASAKIIKPLKPMVETFATSGKDFGVVVHPVRSTMVEEYFAWDCREPGEKDQHRKCLDWMREEYEYIDEYNSLYATGMMIHRRYCSEFENFIYWKLCDLGNGKAERVDQTIFTFLVDRYERSVFPVSYDMLNSDYISHSCMHNGEYPGKAPHTLTDGWVKNEYIPLNYF